MRLNSKATEILRHRSFEIKSNLKASKVENLIKDMPQ